MAITAAQLQAELGATWMKSPRVLQELPPYAVGGNTGQYWLVNGGTAYPGRVFQVSTTASDNAATQATAVLAALLAGTTKGS